MSQDRLNFLAPDSGVHGDAADGKEPLYTPARQQRVFTVAYILSLGLIAVLSVAVHLLLGRVIEEQADSAWQVNRSGEQRMLSQRATLFTLRYLERGDEADRAIAEAALRRLSENAQALLQTHNEAITSGRESPLSPTLHDLYFGASAGIMATVNLFIDEARRTLDKGPGDVEESQLLVTLAQDSLLNGLDRVVSQYQQESENRVAQLRETQRVVLMIILITVAVESLFVFRPLLSSVSALHRRLERATNMDAMTGLLNRRAFDLVAAQQFDISRRYGRPLSILILDIDRFKEVNDTYGHAVGDCVIKQISSLLHDFSRSADFVARIGGEEFVVVCPDTKQERAYILAENLRSRIATSSVDNAPGPRQVTTSIGIAELSPEDDSVSALMKRADDALYQAKRGGRNQSVLSTRKPIEAVA